MASGVFQVPCKSVSAELSGDCVVDSRRVVVSVCDAGPVVERDCETMHARCQSVDRWLDCC